MRTSATSENGLKVRAIAGTYVVLLGFDLPAEKRTGLLGFAVQRVNHTDNRTDWLEGMLPFPDMNPSPQLPVPTNVCPIQKFRWGDYTVKPQHAYTYTVQAMYGAPGSLQVGDSVSVDVQTEDPLHVGEGVHEIHFNRGAAASQAYVAKFGDKDPSEIADGSAYRWLSRGLEEGLIAFIGRAVDNSYSLRLCVYEFQKDSLLDALKQAVNRGVDVQIVYDAIEHTSSSSSAGDSGDGKGPRDANQAAIEKHDLTNVCHPRTHISAISHDKFVVLCREGKAIAVWTGSTNFTDGAIYGQANVGHAVEDANLADLYLRMHQALLGDPDLKTSRADAESISPVPGSRASLYPIFSPRTNIVAIDTCTRLICDAHDLVVITCPFELHKEIQDALAKPNRSFLTYGLLDKANNVIEGVRNDINNSFAVAAYLKNKVSQWQQESFHHQGVHIHTKYILVDPLSDHPIVVTGSANFSANSSMNNDENQLVITGEQAVADVYLGEFMRMYDQYIFRDLVSRTANQPQTRVLSTTDAWTDKYFSDAWSVRSREVFAG